MPIANVEEYLETLKDNYQTLSDAYRMGKLEQTFQLTTKDGLLKKTYKRFSRGSESVRFAVADEGQGSAKDGLLRITYRRFSRADEPVQFKDAAMKLFEQAQRLDASYKDWRNLSISLKEQLTEYQIRAQNLAYEITDYYLTTNPVMAKHFLQLARDVSQDVRAYYHEHYEFVVTSDVKASIVKQTVLGALFGINALYRSYSPAKYTTALNYLQNLIVFLEKDFSKFCKRHKTAFGLVGLAYFLKGRLLLSGVRHQEAEDCFRLSAENYVRKLPYRGEGRADDRLGEHKEHGLLSAAMTAPGAVELPVSKLLALRRAALALAFGSGYSALINSRVKEAGSLLTLARGILHFNSPAVYAAYTELLYWSAQRAEYSNDAQTLRAAKVKVEECRKVFAAHVPDSHYPHRASIEHSLVLHYLAQKTSTDRAQYYQEAIADLEAAVKFAKGTIEGRIANKQLYAEACYILSHLLRYKSADLFPTNHAQSIATLKEACHYAKEAETAAVNFPRHKCEALLALCGVYADVAKRALDLSVIDPRYKATDDPGRLSRSHACKVLELNKGANPRISAICFLRLVDYYLKNPHTYSRAYHYWREWLKIQSTIEHAFVKDWAERTGVELRKIKEGNLVIDLTDSKNIDELRDTLHLSFAKHKIAEWVEQTHRQFKRTNRKHPQDIVRRRSPGMTGRNVYLKTGLEKYLVEVLQPRKKSEVTNLIEQYDLLALATDLMDSYLAEDES